MNYYGSKFPSGRSLRGQGAALCKEYAYRSLVTVTVHKIVFSRGAKFGIYNPVTRKMVIANSDSTNTLVSLDDYNNGGFKCKAIWASHQQIREAPTHEHWLIPTALRVPEDSSVRLEDTDNSCSPSRTSSSEALRLVHLPTESSPYTVDECLGNVPAIRQRCSDLLESGTRHYHASSPARILYVAQGEVAYAVPRQCDVIVSDKATTCHVLILKSVSDHAAPLVSCAHIDGDRYETCIRDMFRRHQTHHEESADAEMDIHIMGGFGDEHGASRVITSWLVRLLAALAKETQPVFHTTTLGTCAVTSLNHCNDSKYPSPIGRGLAMEMESGRVFLASCDTAVAGPNTVLRSVRLWAPQAQPRLHVIHEAHRDGIIIRPFAYKPFADIGTLLALPDDLLLTYTSTSPDCEQDDFCGALRETLRFLQTVPAASVFGPDLGQPLVYRRTGRLGNRWMLVR
ncbi:predicted protein [Phaeodactylum tricornutum CCAP 1055/1]|uniref:Protein N-terminal asparagine amidohydrolase n=2 Tax=Phaeodactylum tricornutum TaxID=2850 RepID=B7FUZ6_PHATC|nr:predicted protein [Phaeodactylum tricornutum CCAP 1055/1]EEC50072.1 predicted protein [Phaeodactylum tricornutum CCAP 1055/1]|eukprot:XP_002178407.1 predicted protein [Phaeodactylum tricornutum CCAP 1055/1]